MISTADFKRGLTIELDGEVYTILDFQHVQLGRGSARVQTKLRNVRTGNVFERTFRAGERMEEAYLERRQMQYLYGSGDEHVFMDTESFDQMTLSDEQLGDAATYLKENLTVNILMHEGRVIGVELPDTVELRVTRTEPGVRGDTATGGSKPAVVESGAMVQVPLFINEGDVIRVDTRTGEYLERA